MSSDLDLDDVAATSPKALAELDALRAERDAFKANLYAELDGNLALRAKGGARDDEPMTVFLERVFAERDRMREALQLIRDRLADHPMYANLTEEEEESIGGDTAEFSYLVRVADEAIGAGDRAKC